jgi:hypothetical protein
MNFAAIKDACFSRWLPSSNHVSIGFLKDSVLANELNNGQKIY